MKSSLVILFSLVINTAQTVSALMADVFMYWIKPTECFSCCLHFYIVVDLISSSRIENPHCVWFRCNCCVNGLSWPGKSLQYVHAWLTVLLWVTHTVRVTILNLTLLKRKSNIIDVIFRACVSTFNLNHLPRLQEPVVGPLFSLFPVGTHHPVCLT